MNTASKTLTIDNDEAGIQSVGQALAARQETSPGARGGRMSGYLTSGRAMADHWLDQLNDYHRSARWCFRNGLISEGKQHLRQAFRALRSYRIYRERITL